MPSLKRGQRKSCRKCDRSCQIGDRDPCIPNGRLDVSRRTVVFLFFFQVFRELLSQFCHLWAYNELTVRLARIIRIIIAVVVFGWEKFLKWHQLGNNGRVKRIIYVELING